MAPEIEPAVARRSRRCNARRLFLWAAAIGVRRPLKREISDDRMRYKDGDAKHT
jgi:hypothetical protein